jgi:hypothetical protein
MAFLFYRLLIDAEEVNLAAIGELDVSFLPCGATTPIQAVPLVFAATIDNLNLVDIDLEQQLDRLPNFLLRCVRSHSENDLVVFLRHDSALFGHVWAF